MTATKSTSARVDSKGRVLLPASFRRRLGIGEGAVVFIREEGAQIEIRCAENPFDKLAAAAEEEFQRGETVSLEELRARIEARDEA